MTLIRADRVAQLSMTEGLDDFVLYGVGIDGFRQFAHVMEHGDTCYYAIECIDGAGLTGQWEIGLATYKNFDPQVIERTVVHASSEEDQVSKVDFAAGLKRVMMAVTVASLTSSGIGRTTLPLVVGIPPQLVYLDDGNLVYVEID